MQAFYTEMFTSNPETDSKLGALLRVAEASLRDVLAVKSELAWEIWDEAAKPGQA